MWMELKKGLAADLAGAIQERFGVAHEPVLEVPPRRDLGDLSSPAAMQLARVLNRNPRAIAGELAAALARPDRPDRPGMVRDIQVEGAGLLNFFRARRAFAAALMDAALIDGIDPRG